MAEKYKPPFPWFGGKSRIASVVWAALGEVRGEYRAQLASTQAALTREAELESAHELLMTEHTPTPPPAE